MQMVDIFGEMDAKSFAKIIKKLDKMTLFAANLRP